MDWTIEVLNRNKHERQSFNCGEESLSTWLKNQASQSQDKGYAKTFVAVDPDAPGTILGYYSLSMFGAASDDFPAGRYPRIVPVAKLGRLAVALPAQRFGLGSELLIDA